jgi:hypothetical protein
VRTTFRKVSEQSAKALFSGFSGFYGGNTETERGRLSLLCADGILPQLRKG